MGIPAHQPSNIIVVHNELNTSIDLCRWFLRCPAFPATRHHSARLGIYARAGLGRCARYGPWGWVEGASDDFLVFGSGVDGSRHSLNRM